MTTIKLIGAGFGRTGTTSIKAALEELGFNPCYHMQEVIKHPSHVQRWQSALRNNTTDWQTIFNGYQATVDWPGCTFYQQLMAAYPDAKVLLTVRDPEKWYDSTRNTIYQIYRKPLLRFFFQLFPLTRRFLALNEALIWQTTFHDRFEDRAYAIDIFNKHNAAVKDAVPGDQLLIYDVKQGWQPLCQFLNVPIPSKPFPHLNDRRTFQLLFLIPQLFLVILALVVLFILGLIIRNVI